MRCNQLEMDALSFWEQMAERSRSQSGTVPSAAWGHQLTELVTCLPALSTNKTACLPPAQLTLELQKPPDGGQRAWGAD